MNESQMNECIYTTVIFLSNNCQNTIFFVIFIIIFHEMLVYILIFYIRDHLDSASARKQVFFVVLVNSGKMTKMSQETKPDYF